MTIGLKAELATHLRRHRDEGILLDTNVLLLLWLATFDPRLIGGKRLEKYTPEDAVLLTGYVGQFKRILTTSTILTEPSNLAALVLPVTVSWLCFGGYSPCLESVRRRDFTAVRWMG